MADENEVKAEVDFASDPKSIFKSKVFWGVVIALLGKYLKIDGIPDLAGDLATVGGAALAVYGRIKATRSATISRPSNVASLSLTTTTSEPTPEPIKGDPKPIAIDGGPTPESK